MNARLKLYWRLVRLDKPIGILLLLWPTLWALFAAADGMPSSHLLLVFIFGTVLMRSAGCAMNDYFDRNVDLHVKRTQNRVLATGELRPREALYIAAVLGLLSLGLVLTTNVLTILLACVAGVLAVTYPLFKRFFAIPQAYLGIAFGFGIPMGFAAIQNEVPPVAWLLLAANVCWAIAYDTEYAMVDRDDDLLLGVKSSAITFGRYDVAIVALCYGMALLLLGVAGSWLSYGWKFFTALSVAAMIASVHIGWIGGRDRQACFKAFLHNTWIGATVFIGIALEVLT
ncbi:4-hydroxybenzoate octaprenyltransferase [Zwartia sp.]|uniref:4-hydroxybenzoate octaprenyltransferase n=1 Tax=Zwartia sp. TaxID=2978004 RepID=UPI002716405D|nr:4-hydroxybenzoate octaprenyltransferase [Zwartia sp.]MDO9025508.1 4-hydroxybenzoate octaprenyltransferase [Zwartia sp.]